MAAPTFNVEVDVNRPDAKELLNERLPQFLESNPKWELEGDFPLSEINKIDLKLRVPESIRHLEEINPELYRENKASASGLDPEGEADT